MKLLSIAAVGTAVLLAASILQGDTIFLKNGSRVEGTLVGADSRQVRFLVKDGQVENYSIRELQSISFGESAARAQSDGSVLVPAATEITVRLIDPIDSDLNDAGQEFRASLAEDLVVDGQVMARRGSDAKVEVVRVEQSGKFKGREEVSLALSEITIGARAYPVTTGFAEVAGDSRGKETAKIVGGTAAVGAIIGAIAGGGKGAGIGAAAGAGAGAAIQAVRGEKVQIPAETMLAFTLTEPVTKG